MKIRRVLGNNRKKVFVLDTRKGVYEFPYSELNLKPTARDPLVHVAPDPELGNEGFTYRLASGKENTVHLEHVLRFVDDLTI